MLSRKSLVVLIKKLTNHPDNLPVYLIDRHLVHNVKLQHCLVLDMVAVPKSQFPDLKKKIFKIPKSAIKAFLHLF